MIDQVLDEDENADSVRTLVDGTWTDVDMSALREAVRRKCATDTMAEVRNSAESARLAMVDIPSLQEATPKEMVQTPCEAVEAAVEMVPVAALQGRVSGEYVYSYPPGIIPVMQTYIFRTNICKRLFTKQTCRVMMWSVDEGGRAHEN